MVERVTLYRAADGNTFEYYDEALAYERKLTLHNYFYNKLDLSYDESSILVNNIDALIELLIELKFVDPKSEDK